MISPLNYLPHNGRNQPNQREWLYDSDETEFSIPSWIENNASRSSKSKCAKQQKDEFGKVNLFPIKCSEKSYTVCEIAGMRDKASPARPVIPQSGRVQFPE